MTEGSLTTTDWQGTRLSLCELRRRKWHHWTGRTSSHLTPSAQKISVPIDMSTIYTETTVGPFMYIVYTRTCTSKHNLWHRYEEGLLHGRTHACTHTRTHARTHTHTSECAHLVAADGNARVQHVANHDKVAVPNKLTLGHVGTATLAGFLNQSLNLLDLGHHEWLGGGRGGGGRKGRGKKKIGRKGFQMPVPLVHCVSG